MKQISLLLLTVLLLASGCTSQKKLSYLNNLPEPGGEEVFNMQYPDYKLQQRDILYVTAKAMGPDGRIQDFLSGQGAAVGGTQMQGEGGGYLYGYEIKDNGFILIPVVGQIDIEGKTLEEARITIQASVDKVFKNTTVDCKLLSFKYTVIGEVEAPGTYMNYNNYLTVFEAIGRAGGINNFGRRDKILVLRPNDKGAETFRINLQDKEILKSPAYFLYPNDVLIIEPQTQKIFNLNLPTIAFVISTITSSITMTLLLIDYLK
jgi:polysaccharide export outer membrane protein